MTISGGIILNKKLGDFLDRW